MPFGTGNDFSNALGIIFNQSQDGVKVFLMILLVIIIKHLSISSINGRKDMCVFLMFGILYLRLLKMAIC